MYQIMLKRASITHPICSLLNGSLHESLNGSYPSYCKNQNPSSAPPGWTWLNFPLSLNMYQIMLKRTSITYPICSFLNGSLYGSLHAQKQSFCKNLNLPLNSSEITSLHHYCTIDSYLGMGLNKCQNWTKYSEKHSNENVRISRMVLSGEYNPADPTKFFRKSMKSILFLKITSQEGRPRAARIIC